jgi:hypothetical protein
MMEEKNGTVEYWNNGILVPSIPQFQRKKKSSRKHESTETRKRDSIFSRPPVP